MSYLRPNRIPLPLPLPAVRVGQIMPTSTYKNPDTRGDGESRADGNGYGDDYGDRMDSFGDELPTEKKQLRQNLSLLKKKMNSQAGSRRSQVLVVISMDEISFVALSCVLERRCCG